MIVASCNPTAKESPILHPLAPPRLARYTRCMDIAAHTARNIHEATNFETLALALKITDASVEPIFERIGEEISLADPLTLHPNTYASFAGLDVTELLEIHSFVKARFLRLEFTDVVLRRGDGMYPAHVATTPDSPRFLYLRGDAGLLSRKCVSVIGTRTPSDEGRRYAKETVQALARHDVAILSGLSMGIEGMAHITALASGTPTIAAIGTSLIEAYPVEHRKLQQAIAEHGLLVSRFSPARQTEKWHFLLRNQLMGALSSGTVIIEDRDGGSAVKQASYALEQKRKVMLFQHVLDNRSLLWPRRLSLKNGVLVVKQPDHIHARLFPTGKREEPKDGNEMRQGQLSLFDLS